MSFIENVENLCRDNNIPVSKMLSDLGMANGAFSNWKNRGTVPNGDILQKIAKYFNVTIDYLLSETTGQKIKRLRIDCNITQVGLADFLDIPASDMGKYERDEKFPDEDTLQRLALHFGVTPEYLAGDEILFQGEQPLTSKQKAALQMAEQLSDEQLKKVIDYADLIVKAENQ